VYQAEREDVGCAVLFTESAPRASRRMAVEQFEGLVSAAIA
jgi:hypothetical protein